MLVAPEPIRTASFEAQGHATLRAYDTHDAGGGTCAFTRLAFSFPLKLLSPRQTSIDAVARARAARIAHFQRVYAPCAADNAVDADLSAMSDEAVDARLGLGPPCPVGALYVAGYGGGLVSGDSVHLDIDVGTASVLLLLTQGSTKVFKKRGPRISAQPAPDLRNNHASAPLVSGPSRQTMRFIVRPGASLFLLPDAVTCFEAAEYEQVQRIDVRDATTSSLVLLDWYTAGRTRMAAPGALSDAPAGTNPAELWGFERYASRNEVRVAGTVVVRDSLVLDQPPPVPGLGTAQPTLAQRCAPYGCYATIYLLGPAAQQAIIQLMTAFDQIQQRMVRAGATPPILWSISVLSETPLVPSWGRQDVPCPYPYAQPLSRDPNKPNVLRTAVLRVAGPDADTVRGWFRTHLQPLMFVVGDDLYRQAFGGLPEE